jgi:hypothetical protein
MTDRPLRRLFWHVADELDYLVTLARLGILDAVCGPLSEILLTGGASGPMGCDQPLLIIQSGSNHRECQLRRARRASAHKRLASGSRCSIRAPRAALYSNPDTWDTRSCSPTAPG